MHVAIPCGLEEQAGRVAVATGIEQWYRAQAAEAIAESVVFWSPALGREPRAIYVRNQKRLWGSCAADGTLRFNWRLVQMAPALIDYVVVHELAHLKVHNHSTRFWDEVAQVLPDYLDRRESLRAAGALAVL